MGAAFSQILAQAAARQGPAPSRDPVVVCNTRKVELNQIRTDLSNKQNEVDGCDPAEKATRIRNKYIQENADFINRLWPEFTMIEKDFNSKIADADSLVKVIGPLQSYNEEMTKELEELHEKEKKYTHEERFFRRNFLDNKPQEGVSSILFQRTADDKVLLAFWICFLIGVSALVAVGMTVYGPRIGDQNKQLQVGVAIVLALWGIAYGCITYLG